MRSARSRGAARGAVLLTGVATLLLAGPAAIAQQTERKPVPPRWSGSAFDEPFDTFVTEPDTDRIDVSGIFRFEKPTATSEIVGVEVGIVDDDADDFEPDDDCESPEPVEIPSDGTSAADDVDQLAFDVDDLHLPCNGRYLLEARADTNVADTSYTMRAALVVEHLPPAVEDLSVTGDRVEQQVTVDWEPVAEDDLPPDAFGYLLERAGPQDSSGAFGIFDDLVVADRSDTPQLVDDLPEPGTYRYRVRTLREGPDGPVLSSILHTDVETVTVQAPPPTTTSSTAPPTTGSSPRVGTAIPRAPSRPATTRSPPTTADTGFEERLDYGTPRPRPTTTDLPELPSEEARGGQSIVRDEGDGGGALDMIVPAAGALVLIGWAGHLAYLNRLAKQL